MADAVYELEDGVLVNVERNNIIECENLVKIYKTKTLRLSLLLDLR